MNNESIIQARDVPAVSQAHRSTCGCRPCCARKNADKAPSPNWPCNAKTGRITCTASRVMPERAKGQWVHPDATSEGGDSEYEDAYKCPNCGTGWIEQLPDY